MLSVRAETLGEVTVLHLRGRITIGNATKTLNEVVRAQTAACALVLDLAEVDLIDARGLGMLVELHQWTQSRGIEFRLMNVSRLIQQVMSITRLDTVLQMYRQRKSSTQGSIATLERRHATARAVRGGLT
jgi:anti-anti-sigma factor